MPMLRRVKIILLVLLCTGSAVSAQVSLDPCGSSAYHRGCYFSLARSLEQNGKLYEAWEYYMKALRVGPRVAAAVDPRTGRAGTFAEDLKIIPEIVEGIIRLRNRIEPRPQISRDAYAAMQRGIAAVDGATGPKDFVIAEQSFETAVMLAPWWPDALLNLAYTREALGVYPEALQSFRLYLLAAPNADDSDKVRAKIKELERK